MDYGSLLMEYTKYLEIYTFKLVLTINFSEQACYISTAFAGIAVISLQAMLCGV